MAGRTHKKKRNPVRAAMDALQAKHKATTGESGNGLVLLAVAGSVTVTAVCNWLKLGEIPRTKYAVRVARAVRAAGGRVTVAELGGEEPDDEERAGGGALRAAS